MQHLDGVTPAWQSIAFVSDLHLQVDAPDTAALWLQWLDAWCHQPSMGDALFLLGDVFEVWIGDDALTESPPTYPHEQAWMKQCLMALKHLAQQKPVFWMSGNRDFLLSRALIASLGLHWLDDPCSLDLGSTDAPESWLLSHGDVFCVTDTAYQAFRTLSRGAAWQTDFLSKPLSERWQLAQHMRAQSRAYVQHLTESVDVDVTLVQNLYPSCRGMVHGHTHRPQTERLTNGWVRHVLSDWHPTSAEILWWHKDRGFFRQPLCS